MVGERPDLRRVEWGVAHVCVLQDVGHRGQRQRITRDAEAADHADGRFRNIGVLPEFLPAVDVGQVNLDDGQLDREQRVHQRD